MKKYILLNSILVFSISITAADKKTITPKQELAKSWEKLRNEKSSLQSPLAQTYTPTKPEILEIVNLAFNESMHRIAMAKVVKEAKQKKAEQSLQETQSKKTPEPTILIDWIDFLNEQNDK